MRFAVQYIYCIMLGSMRFKVSCSPAGNSNTIYLKWNDGVCEQRRTFKIEKRKISLVMEQFIDNASTDGANKVAELFCNKYDHMHFLQMESNIHQMPAYNLALNWVAEKYPDAEVMCQLDSDDELKPDALCEVYNTFLSHPFIGQTYSGFDIIDKNGNVKHSNHPKAAMAPNQFTAEGQRVLRNMFIRSNPIGHFRCMRIRCVRELGGFDESRRFATDYNMAGLMLSAYPIVKINKVLYRWRQHDTQVERQHGKEQTQDWKDMQNYYRGLFNSKGLL